MVLKDRGPFSVIRLFSAFKYAVQGIQYAAKSEKNFQIHLFAASIVIILSFFLKLDKVEWIFIIISIFGVMALELVNSAMERAVDLATDKIHPLAKQAKDLAAAGVLVYTLMAVLIGILILGPKIIQLFY
nr:diacylglycerol kinase family protein [Lederbergia galactosidilytica]